MYFKKSIGHVEPLHRQTRKKLSDIITPWLQPMLNNLNIPQWIIKNQLGNMTEQLLENLKREKSSKVSSWSRAEKTRSYVENSLETLYNTFTVLYSLMFIDNYSRTVFSLARGLLRNLDYESLIAKLNNLLRQLNDTYSRYQGEIIDADDNAESLEKLVESFQRWMDDEIHRAAISGFLQALETVGIKKYTYRTSGGENVCEACKNLDGREFEVSEAEEGVNLPPMHPNCRCRIGTESNEFNEYAYWEAIESVEETLSRALQAGLTQIQVYYINMLRMFNSLSRLSRMLLGQLAEQSQYGSNIQIGMMLASFLSSLYLTQQEIAENYEYNLLLDIFSSNALSKDRYIVYQHELSTWKYGKRDSEYNGCGWMAIYNALLALGHDPGHPADIIKWLEEQPMLNGAILAGQFGSYPWSVGEYFEKQGYDVDYSVMLWGSLIPGNPDLYFTPSDMHIKAENADVNIMFYQWRNGSAHYVAFFSTGERDDGGDEIYIFYNEYSKDTPEGIYTGTLQEFGERTEPIMQIVISIKEQE